MNLKDKTKEQLIEELIKMNRKVADLEFLVCRSWLGRKGL